MKKIVYGIFSLFFFYKCINIPSLLSPKYILFSFHKFCCLCLSRCLGANITGCSILPSTEKTGGKSNNSSFCWFCALCTSSKLLRRRVELIRHGWGREDLEKERGGRKERCLLPDTNDFPSQEAVVLCYYTMQRKIQFKMLPLILLACHFSFLDGYNMCCVFKTELHWNIFSVLFFFLPCKWDSSRNPVWSRVMQATGKAPLETEMSIWARKRGSKALSKAQLPLPLAEGHLSST